MKKSGEALFELARSAMAKAGANSKMAEATARHLVRADGAAEPAVSSTKPGVCLIDNRDGLPYVSAALAVDEVIRRAKQNGIAFAGIRNSSRAGVLGVHLQPIAEAGLVGFGFTNSPAAIPAWGGKKGLFGTNPTGAAIGAEADSFFSEEGNKPRIGQAFIAIDPGALAGTERYLERVETVIAAMQADAEVRLPGARRFGSQRAAAAGIEVPDELIGEIEKLCTT